MVCRRSVDVRLSGAKARLAPSAILALSIADTGPGISPPVLAKMFEERFTTKSADRGTGLGLSIVRRLLREAEGAIMIRTEVGAGSTFIVLLQTRA